MDDCDRRVLLLLGPAFEDAEAAIALDVCGWTAYRPHLPKIGVTIAALHDRVEGRFGLSFDNCALVSSIDMGNYDGLIIPGGFRPAYDEIYCDGVYDIIRSCALAGKPIATMCVGAIVAARAGVLEGGFATTYEFSRHSNYDMMAEYGCEGRHEPVCDFRGIISCSGPAYTDKAMRLFIEHLVGPEAAQELTTFRQGISR